MHNESGSGMRDPSRNGAIHSEKVLATTGEDQLGEWQLMRASRIPASEVV